MKKALRLLYQPYKFLFFLPFLVLSTVVFGAGAVLLCSIFDPRIPSYLCGSVWAKLNALMTPMLLKVTGRKNIDQKQSYVIVSNHQSQYDILALYGWMGVDFKWVMKQELRKIPALGIACEKLGHIYIDRSAPQAAISSIQAARQKVVNGTSVIFFPEGTRSRSGKIAPFKKGAFKMALDLQIPILPVTICGTRKILPPDTIDIFPGKTGLIIHKPVAIDGYDDDNITELMDRVRDIIRAPLNRC
ncbi:1-acyl-sn-glycerol-3-phosphate acyltransferase [Desulfonema ishimotonii]|uniref:1-acyl-sn-glycerol-3-phosphate acyltransferase n=1 Tax=Desulfonema ishimotonii TaxID=45657 RepID=A0A401G064_9BACT|nr:lysophospholipid acyltransferase family protein [Desulfonema ishimotonii]GBC62587.1 1-acyl-sn-glycerol-3-phosphate acyltransferase [Desulfonema ishimotonii]